MRERRIPTAHSPARSWGMFDDDHGDLGRARRIAPTDRVQPAATTTTRDRASSHAPDSPLPNLAGRLPDAFVIIRLRIASKRGATDKVRRAVEDVDFGGEVRSEMVR